MDRIAAHLGINIDATREGADENPNGDKDEREQEKDIGFLFLCLGVFFSLFLVAGEEIEGSKDNE